LAVLVAYFDGSGKSHDPSTPFLTLVGYAAEAAVWPAFEVAWIKILTDHNVDFLHFKEPKVRENPLLLGLLLETIAKAGVFGMHSVSCSVAVSEYRKLGDAASPGRVCAEWCINQLLSQASSLSCFFDRGEEFFKEVNNPWENDSQEWPELSKVSELGLVRSRDFPGIQAADWLGWYINRSLTKFDHDIDLRLLVNRAGHCMVIKP
jgi:hypothetical protein